MKVVLKKDALQAAVATSMTEAFQNLLFPLIEQHLNEVTTVLDKRFEEKRPRYQQMWNKSISLCSNNQSSNDNNLIVQSLTSRCRSQLMAAEERRSREELT